MRLITLYQAHAAGITIMKSLQFAVTSNGIQKMQNKVIFADQLRAIAFLSVLIVHWLGTFSVDRQLASTTINAYVAGYGIESIYQRIVPDFIPGFGFGPFGVGVFFIISGFVIPFSLIKKNGLQFIRSRALRIMPTYLACIILSIVLISSTGESEGFLYLSPKEIFYNATLLQTITLDRSVDMVNWTLAIEIKFYIICAILRNQIKNGSMIPFIIIPLLSLFVNCFSIRVPGMLSVEMIFISFMLSGVAVNLMYRNLISLEKFSFIVVYILASTVASLYHSKISPQAFDESMSLLYALILFFTAYYCRDKIKPSRVLGFIAKISYPLYLLHVTFGFTILNLLLSHGFSKPASYISALTSVMLASYVIHITIESRTMGLTKRNILERA